ncbi:glutathione S-transferase [Mycena polygramma]|nr:glutathione S-transferase [Mycena polygramma]
MVLKLYGPNYAAGGNGLVAMVLAEKQIPFELVEVEMSAKAHKTPEFLAMHPFGQVPVIDDDGFILCESRAICRYLADKYPDQGTPLFPTDLKARALVEQAASFEFANFHPAATKVAMELLGKARRGLPVDHAVVAEGVTELSAKLDVYEVILGKHRFIAGDEFSLADIFHLGFAPLLAGTEADVMTKETRPNVARWWNEVISRPTWVKLKAEGIKSTVS